MKILNDIKIDFSLKDRMYELTIVCKNESEISTAFEKLSDKFNVEHFEDNDVTVMAYAWKYQTKQDFIKKVRELLKN